MDDKDIKELHSIMLDYCIKKSLKPTQILAFLSATFIGTMALQNYDEDFFNATVDLMKIKFKKHPIRQSKI